MDRWITQDKTIKADQIRRVKAGDYEKPEEPKANPKSIAKATGPSGYPTSSRGIGDDFLPGNVAGGKSRLHGATRAGWEGRKNRTFGDVFRHQTNRKRIPA